MKQNNYYYHDAQCLSQSKTIQRPNMENELYQHSQRKHIDTCIGSLLFCVIRTNYIFQIADGNILIWFYPT